MTTIENREAAATTPAIDDRVSPDLLGNERSGVSTRRIPRPDVALTGFVVLAIVFGSVFAVITPPTWGADEATHITRAWAVSQGEFVSPATTGAHGLASGDTLPASIDNLIRWMGPLVEDHPAAPEPQIAHPIRVDILESVSLATPPRPAVFTGAAVTSPVPYLPASGGLLLARAADTSVGTALLLARLAGLFTFVLLVGAAIHALREHRARWLVVVVALVPMTLFQAATITTDTLTLGFSLLISALILKSVFLRRRLSVPETIGLVAAACLVPLCKAGYIVFLPLALLVPASLLPGRRLTKGASALVLALGAVAFVSWTRLTTSGMVIQRGGELGPISQSGQLDFMTGDPRAFVGVMLNTFALKDHMYFTQFFGDLGFTFVSIPVLAIVLVILAAVVAAGASERFTAPIGSTGVVALAVVLGAATVFGALYLNYSPVGYYFVDGIQGRYFAPFVLLTLCVVLRVAPLRWHLPEDRHVRACGAAVICLVAAALALSAWKYSFVVWG